MKRLVFFALLSLLVTGTEGKIRVGVHQGLCSYASMNPTPPAISIIAELNGESWITATYVSDDMIDTSTELANYDVLYFGSGGMDINRDKLSPATATAVAAWVNGGGGLITSSLSNMDLITPQSIMAPLMPVVQWSSQSYYCRPQPYPAFGYPYIYVNTALYGQNAITRSGLPSMWGVNAFTFFSPQGIASGATTLASIRKESGLCCTSAETCDLTLTESLSNQAILTRNVGNGRVAWFSAPYCGYELYQPGNLRSGPNHKVFVNAISWASGKCKSSNDCNLHGNCNGDGTCVCDEEYTGATCSVFSPVCALPCVHGTCVDNSGSRTCVCWNHWMLYGGTCNSGCESGWYGSNCSIQAVIRDPGFEESPSQWTVTGTSPIVVATTPAAHGGTHIAHMSDTDTPGVQTISQEVQLLSTNNAEYPLYLSFFSYPTFSAGSTNYLLVKVDGVAVMRIDATNSAGQSSWVEKYVNISAYANDAPHWISFTATTVSGSSRASFNIDDVKVARGVCSPVCSSHGTCNYPALCKCEAHYEGPTCSSATCGDGYLIAGLEACDDGNKNPGDGCSETCTVERGYECSAPVTGIKSVCKGVCGNGIVTPGEACDDNNTKNGDGCNSTCAVEAFWSCTNPPGLPTTCDSLCGDGIVVMKEECDDNNTKSGDGCSATCKIESNYDCIGQPSVCIPESCPDSKLTKSEQCDDGNATPYDGCNATCGVEHGWSCTSVKGAKSVCTEPCGNSITTQNEKCDDGNNNPGDGCNPDCTIQSGWKCDITKEPSVCEQVCGNSIITKDETCDDGNSNPYDGCSDKCKIEPGWNCRVPGQPCQRDVCGNGELESGTELCDDGNTEPYDGCNSNCTVQKGWVCTTSAEYAKSNCTEVCGNRMQTKSEECDDGTANGANDGCDEFCKITPGWECVTNLNTLYSFCERLCGNAIILYPEVCDDGNKLIGDGCDYDCKVESGWNCSGTYNSSCHTVCGDSMLRRGETCDDGNTDSGDGCSSTCKVEHGYTCNTANTEAATPCTWSCGDKLISNQETCDDGNKVGGDGCSSTCKIETDQAWQCSGEPSVCKVVGCPNRFVTANEQCDDNNNNANDGCTNCVVDAGYDCRGEPSTCVLEVCGNGDITKSEKCDDGNKVNGDGCNSLCQIERGFRCVVIPGETKSTCGLDFRCGNGYTTSDEECDDENTANGDGCSSACKIEPGWICNTVRGFPSVCHELRCGDGLTEGAEACDDGNTAGGDGCSADCSTVEPGFSCISALCKDSCGNGVRSKTEACDDGNRINGDGCNSTCGIERGWRCSPAKLPNGDNCTYNCKDSCSSTCGDGLLASNEECDDGNVWTGDGCSSYCKREEGWKCIGVKCVVKKCDIMMLTMDITNIRCGGSTTGEIAVSANASGILTYQLLGPNRILPPFEDVGKWVNLAAGTYYVNLMLDGDSMCTRNFEAIVTEPTSLTSGPVNIQFPTACNSKDGGIQWSVFGGTPPITYKMGGLNSSNGVFSPISRMEFSTIVATDANGCVLETTDQEVPKPEECIYEGFNKFINDLWTRGGLSGVILLGCTGGVVVVGMIGYCAWDHKKTKKEKKEAEEAELGMQRSNSAGYASVEMGPVST